VQNLLDRVTYTTLDSKVSPFVFIVIVTIVVVAIVIGIVIVVIVLNPFTYSPHHSILFLHPYSIISQPYHYYCHLSATISPPS
jgi:hypothetical protein